MNDPRVSVVLPTYNRAQHLPRSIASVLGQTFADFELIVVDDGSTDATQSVVEAIRDPRLSYVRAPRNGGVSAARNLGIERARGSLVAFQDSDDEWRVDKLRRQVTALDADGGDVVLVTCGKLCINHYPMSFIGVDSPQPVVDISAMATSRLPGAPTWLVRRDAVLAAGGFDTRINCFEDWELALRLSRRGRILMVNEALHIFQKTPGSLFSTERNFIPNLQIILDRHGDLLRSDRGAWAFYCNLLGQSLCQFDRCSEGRPWFREAIRAAPRGVRGWLNLTMSFLGSAAFRRYQATARTLRARLAPPVRAATAGAGNQE